MILSSVATAAPTERWQIDPLDVVSTAVRAKWAQLAERTAYGVFGSPAFVEAVGSGAAHRKLLTAWQGESLLAAAGLESRRLASGIEILGPVSGARRAGARNGLLDRTAVSVASPAAVAKLAHSLVALCASSPTVLALPYLPANSAWTTTLRDLARSSDMAEIWLSTDAEHWLSLQSEWPHFPGATAHRRQRLAALSRRAGLRFTLEAPRSSQEVEGLMGAVERVERASWKYRAGTAPLHGPASAAYRRLVDAASADGLIRVGLAWSGGVPVAYQIGFASSDTYGSYLSAFAESHRHLSPGTLLTVEMFKLLHGDGKSIYSFLRGDESYKANFGTQVRQLGLLVVGHRRFLHRALVGEVAIPRASERLRATAGQILRRNFGVSGSALRARLLGHGDHQCG